MDKEQVEPEDLKIVVSSEHTVQEEQYNQPEPTHLQSHSLCKPKNEEVGRYLTASAQCSSTGTRELVTSRQGGQIGYSALSTPTILHLDNRIFPHGIFPGHVVEVTGSSGCGKTFFLAYCLAQYLLKYEGRGVVLLDIANQFDLRNFLELLRNCDSDFRKTTTQTLIEDSKSSKEEVHARFVTLLKRVHVLRCNTTEDFLMGAVHDECTLKSLVSNKDAAIGLVLIDGLDSVSFCPTMSTKDQILILASIKKAVGHIPILGSTIRGNGVGDSGSWSGRLDATNGVKLHLQLDHEVFTHYLHISSTSTEEKEKLFRRYSRLGYNNGHYVVAHLRSRHSAKSAGAGSGLSHRLKFSIFSDMLWIIDD